MGCYHKPGATKQDFKDAANHLVFLMSQIGEVIPETLEQAASAELGESADLIADEGAYDYVPELCQKLRDLAEDHPAICGETLPSQELRSWWDDHQAFDLEREAA